MIQWIKTSFLLCFVSGCVTVTEHNSESQFDIIAAADARIELGLNYLQRQNRVKAQENLELAIKYAPNYYRSLISIAYYYQQVGEAELARQAYQKAMRESPKNSDVLNNYATFLCQGGEYKKAEQLFLQAIEQPGYTQVASSYENAALCALQSGEIQKAVHYFERSLDHEPSRFVSTFKLAELAVKAGDYSQARFRLLKFHKMYGYKKGSLNLLIKLEQLSGNEPLAKKYSQLFAQLYPNSISN